MVVLYHKRCWAANIIGVKSSSYVACRVEFVELVDEFLSNENVSTMADLHATYLDVYKSNGLTPRSR